VTRGKATPCESRLNAQMVTSVYASDTHLAEPDAGVVYLVHHHDEVIVSAPDPDDHDAVTAELAAVFRDVSDDAYRAANGW
jgi:hypothetical protein